MEHVPSRPGTENSHLAEREHLAERMREAREQRENSEGQRPLNRCPRYGSDLYMYWAAAADGCCLC